MDKFARVMSSGMVGVLSWRPAECKRRRSTSPCPGQSIQAAIDGAAAGDTIAVTGACAENVLVRNEKQRITISGSAASINGPSSASPTVNIRGKGILLQGFTITGGSVGVHVNRGSNAVITSNTIENSGGSGILVDQLSFAAVTNNLIQNKAGDGIRMNDNSTARVGFNTFTDPAGPNNILSNGGSGISVALASSARIAHNTISGNSADGVTVLGSSFAGIGFRTQEDTSASPNTISGNGISGVRAELTSSAVIVGNTISNNADYGVEAVNSAGVTIASNSISGHGLSGVWVVEGSTVFLGEVSGSGLFRDPNSGTNTQHGIKCERQGTANGRIGTLTGSLGAKNFGLTLTLSLATFGSSDLNWGPTDEVDDGNTVSPNATRLTATVTGSGASGTELFKMNKENCRDALDP